MKINSKLQFKLIMANEFINVLRKITRWKIIAVYILLFFVISLSPFKFFPDYLMLGNLSAKRDVVFKLLTTIIGFSGLILTVLLVAYNFFIKTTRRNTLEFATDNKWLQRIFSYFFGNVLFLSLGFFLIETSSFINEITILYFSFIITLTFILSLFPLAILSLNDTVSLKKIDKLINTIKDQDINELVDSNYDEFTWHHKIERNPILILRDIGTAAVTDKDWILPQTILIGLFNLLIGKLNNKSPNKIVQRNIFVWSLYCNHIKREIVKQNDFISGKTLLHLNLRAHEHFVKHNIIDIRSNEIDNFLRNYFKLIIETNSFTEIQAYFATYIIQLIKFHFEQLHYPDEETRPISYIRESKDATKFEATSTSNYWFYLTRELPDLIFDVFECAVDSKCKTVYNNFIINIDGLIVDFGHPANKLTHFQKADALEKIFSISERIKEYAIEKGIYDGIDTFGEIIIDILFEVNNNMGLRGMYFYSKIIKTLYRKNALSTLYIDNYFLIIRYLSKKKPELPILNQAVQIVIDQALKMIQEATISDDTRNYFLYELSWFYDDYLLEIRELNPSKEKYRKAILEILTAFDYHNTSL